MPRRISLYVLLLVSLGVLLNHLSVTPKDNGYLLVIDGKEVDALGMAQDKWVKLTRNCEQVKDVEKNSQQYLDILKTIQNYSPPNSESAQIVRLLSTGEWSLAEVRFTALLPAIVLIQQVNSHPSIVQNGIWSGQTHPWHAAPYIRRYITSQVPQAPTALIECADPTVSNLGKYAH